MLSDLVLTGGNDTLKDGVGNGVLIGDNSLALTPLIKITVQEAGETKIRKLVDSDLLFGPVVEHVSLSAGNDGLDGGAGNDSMVGDDAVFVSFADYGWFIDPTPGQDEDYLSRPDGSLLAKPGSNANGRMDLITVISHEIGHLLGFEHTEATNGPAELMAAALAAGVREIPASPPAGYFAADRIVGMASGAAVSSGVSYFDANSGLFVKADQQTTPAAKKEQDEFLVDMNKGPSKPRHELHELTSAHDKGVTSVTPVILSDESDSLVAD